MSEADVRQAIEAAAPLGFADLPADESCPVQCLGRKGNLYYFLTRHGEVLEVPANGLTDLGLKSIFGGDLAWAREHFPLHDKDGDPRKGTWSAAAIATYLIARCTRAGIFDPIGTPVRGIGVWSNASGRLVIHAGDAIYHGGEWTRPGLLLDGAIYAAGSRVERPALKPADKELGRQLLALLQRWAYESSVGAEVLLGFIGAAALGGAPPFRSHVLVVGARGTGKTWSASLMAAALGGGAFTSTNITEAGLRQALSGEARALVLDESEADEAGAAMMGRVIKLIRQMSSGEGAKVWRGSPQGKATAFSVTGCAALFAILPPALPPQDRSRITTVRLAPLPSGQANVMAADQVVAQIEDFKARSPALRARAIAGWPRFLDSFAVYRAAFMRAGCDGRDSDRIATLLAGRDLLIHDHVPDSDSAEAEVARFRCLIEEAAEQADEGEGQQCLTHLLTSTADLWRGGERETIANVIIKATQADMDGPSSRRALEKVGLKLDGWQSATTCRLLVANQHVALEKIFTGTRWAACGWRQAIRYLPGAEAIGKTTRFGGVSVRSTSVPNALLPRASDGEEDENSE